MADPTSTTQIQVDTAALAETAIQIAAAANVNSQASVVLGGLRGYVEGFDHEPTGDAYSNMLLRAEPVLDQLMNVIQQLAANVAAAAEGYLTTDDGLMPTGYLGWNNHGRIHA